MKKRMIALLLAVIMVASMLPTTALADGAAPPTNVRWTSGEGSSYLMGAWDPPEGAASHEGYDYDVGIYHSYNGVDDWKSLGAVYYATTYSRIIGEIAVDLDQIAQYGEGYYKLKVACSALSVDGSSEWAECEELYHLDYSTMTNRIAAPLSGSYDADAQILRWTDPADIDSNGDGHRAIVEVWHTEAEGEASLHKRAYCGEVTSVALDEVLSADDLEKMEAGQYIFKVSNLAEDYLWRGGSDATLLTGTYEHIKEDAGEDEPAVGNMPSGVAWTDAGGITWDLPSDATGIEGIELELLYAEEEPIDNEQWVAMEPMSYNSVRGSLEMLAMIRMELGARMENKMKEAGYGWYNVRMCYHYADGDSDWTYAWPRLFENGGGSLPSVATATGLQWNTIHTSDTASKAAPGYMAFRAPENALYDLRVYYRSSTGTYNIASWSGRVWDKDYACVDFIEHLNNWNEGSYYFTVQLRDDAGNYGEVATSDDWTYDRPDKILQATNLTWDTENNRITWEMEEELVQWASVDFYFNSEADDPSGARYLTGFGAIEASMEVSRYILDNGEGWYYFKVRLGSKDVTQALSSQNEPLSGALHFTGAERQLALINPVWTGEGFGHEWTISEADAALVDRYEVDYYYCESADVQPDLSFDSPVYNEYFWPGDKDEFKMPGKVVEGDDTGSGWYYFTVRAVSKNPLKAGDSALVLSSAMSYTVPELKLTITEPGWTDDGHLTWTEGFVDSALVDYYDIRFYYGKTEDSINYDQPCWWYDCTVNALPLVLPAEMVKECGTGWYTYDIRAVSADPTAAQSGAWSTRSTPIHSDDAMQPMPQADKLKWGTYYWTDERYESRTGAISFTGIVPQDLWEVDYRVNLYRQDATGDVLVGTMWDVLYRDESIHGSVDPFDQFPELMESGVYYFTVTAMARDSYVDSAPVKSSTWEYKRPSAELTVSDPVWDSGMTMNWTNGSVAADGYQIQYQVVKAGGELDEKSWKGTMNLDADEYPAQVSIGWLQSNGTGDYYFRVRALSNDINKTAPSAWSEASAAYPFTAHNITLAATNLRWNTETQTMEFDLPEGADPSMVDRYQIRFYYGESADGYDHRLDGTKVYVPGEGPYILPTKFMEQGGSGYYWFSVRVYSKDYTKAFDSDGYSELVSEPLYYAGAQQQLPNPVQQFWLNSDVVWGVTGDSQMVQTTVDRNGSVVFSRLKNEDGSFADLGRFAFEICDNSTKVCVYEGTIDIGHDNTDLYVAVTDFIYEDMTNGIYYLRVRALGDGIRYADSDWADSGLWGYTKPAAKLDTPADLQWNLSDYTDENGKTLPIAEWDEVENRGFFEIAFYFAKDAESTPEYIGGRRELRGNSEELTAQYINKYGAGHYFFKVRAVPEDIKAQQLSAWSELSPAYVVEEADLPLTRAGLAVMIAHKFADQLQPTDEKISFSDLEDCTEEEIEAITLLAQHDIVSGNADGTFNPGGTVSGMAVAVVLYRAYSGDNTAAPADIIAGLTAEGILKDGEATDMTVTGKTVGAWLGRIKLPVKLTRAQLAVMIADAFELQSTNEDINFTDIENCTEAEKAAIILLAQNGIVSGTKEGAFNPDGQVAGYAAALILYRAYMRDYGAAPDAAIAALAEEGILNAEDAVNTVITDKVFVQWLKNVEIPTAMTRAELAERIVRKFDLQGTVEAVTFTDIAGCTEAQQKAIIILAQNGIVAGTAPGVFSPDLAVTGKQAALAIYRAYTGDLSGGRDALDNAVAALIEEGILYKGEAGMAAVSGRTVDIWLKRITTIAEVKGALDALLPSEGGETDTPSADTIQNAVAELDQLGQAMATDAAKGTTETMDKLKDLEIIVKNELDVEAEVQVDAALTEQFAGADASNLILNVDSNAADENVGTTTVTLNISKADEAIVPPEDMINTDNAVVFSMDIENAKDADTSTDSHELLVPMQITLPIPTNLNPSFLVILHEKAVGVWESLSLPHVYKGENGQWFARFNVTSFSNYAIGERAITVEAEGKTVTVEAHLPTCGTETTYMCAVYAADGQMLGMNTMKPWADKAIKIDLIEEAGEGAYVRIFAPDTGAGWTVPFDAMEVPVQ